MEAAAAADLLCEPISVSTCVHDDATEANDTFGVGGSGGSNAMIKVALIGQKFAAQNETQTAYLHASMATTITTLLGRARVRWAQISSGGGGKVARISLARLRRRS